MQGISVVIPFYCGNSYLETMAEQLKKNINNFNVVKSAIKGLNDGLKESKKIEYWKV